MGEWVLSVLVDWRVGELVVGVLLSVSVSVRVSVSWCIGEWVSGLLVCRLVGKWVYA